ncbi:hypothetical protein HY734_03425 [Candidatus Uhrbacteria bacterium]|nr:hypothetical protein [Candidatus Uhrbacteria bacterium]
MGRESAARAYPSSPERDFGSNQGPEDGRQPRPELRLASFNPDIPASTSERRGDRPAPRELLDMERVRPEPEPASEPVDGVPIAREQMRFAETDDAEILAPMERQLEEFNRRIANLRPVKPSSRVSGWISGLKKQAAVILSFSKHAGDPLSELQQRRDILQGRITRIQESRKRFNEEIQRPVLGSKSVEVSPRNRADQMEKEARMLEDELREAKGRAMGPYGERPDDAERDRRNTVASATYTERDAVRRELATVSDLAERTRLENSTARLEAEFQENISQRDRTATDHVRTGRASRFQAVNTVFNRLVDVRRRIADARAATREETERKKAA